MQTTSNTSVSLLYLLKLFYCFKYLLNILFLMTTNHFMNKNIFVLHIWVKNDPYTLVFNNFSPANSSTWLLSDIQQRNTPFATKHRRVKGDQLAQRRVVCLRAEFTGNFWGEKRRDGGILMRRHPCLEDQSVCGIVSCCPSGYIYLWLQRCCFLQQW